MKIGKLENGKWKTKKLRLSSRTAAEAMIKLSTKNTHVADGIPHACYAEVDGTSLQMVKALCQRVSITSESCITRD